MTAVNFGTAGDVSGGIDSSNVNPVSLGARFSVASSGVITSLRLYARVAGTYKMRLQDAIGNVLATPSNQVVSGAGWVTFPIAPFAVAPGINYVAVGFYPSGQWHQIAMTSPTTRNGITWDTSLYTFAADISNPVSGDSANYYLQDIGFDTATTLLAQWDLNEGAAATDSGSSASAFTYNYGAVGNGTSVHGDGSRSIAVCTTVPSSINGANTTIETWVTLPGGNVKGAFKKIGSSSNGWGVGIGNTQWDNLGQKLILLSETVAWHPTTYTFPGAGDYHVVVARGAAGAVTAYVNNVAVWSGTLSSPVTASGEMSVGGVPGHSAAFTLSSTVNVRKTAVYASVLSAARVTAHYNGGAGDNTAVAADSPVVWLKHDEMFTVGTTFADATGYGRAPSVEGAPVPGQVALATGIPGGSVRFSNATDAGHLGSTSTAWFDNARDFSIRVWFQTSAASVQAFVTKDNAFSSPGATNRKLQFYIDSAGKVNLTTFTTAGGFPNAASPLAYNDNLPHQAVVTRDASNIKVYIDGAVKATTSVAGTTPAGNVIDLYIGQIVGVDWHMVGLLDHIGIWAGALTPTEVADLYTAEAVGTPSARLDAAHAAVLTTGAPTARLDAAYASVLTPSTLVFDNRTYWGILGH